MDNHPILLNLLAALGGLGAGAGITNIVWHYVARRREKTITAWAHMHFDDTGTFTQALSEDSVTRRNKVQQRVTVGAEHE